MRALRTPSSPLLDQSRSRGRAISWLLWLPLGMLVLAYFVHPYVLRATIPRMLAERDIAAAFERVYLDLTNGTLAFRDATLGDEAGVRIQGGDVQAKFNPRALLDGRVEVTGLTLSDASAEIGDLSALLQSIGGARSDLALDEIVLEDVQLEEWSDELGSPVVLRQASITRLRELDEGGSAQMVGVAVAESLTVRVTGKVRLEDGDPTFEGQIKVDDTELDALAAGFDSARWRGALHIDGDARARYLRDRDTVDASFAGAARARQLDVAFAERGFASEELRFEGSLSTQWPLAAALPGFHAKGVIAASAVRVSAGGQRAEARHQLTLRAPRFDGTLSLGERAEFTGVLSGSGLAWTAPAPKATSFAADRFTLRGRGYRTGGSREGGYWVDELRFATAKAVRGGKWSGAFTADDVHLSDFYMDGGGNFSAGAVTVASGELEPAVGGAGTQAPLASRWRLDNLGAKEVSGELGTSLMAGVAEVALLSRVGPRTAKLSDIRAETVAVDDERGLVAGELVIAALNEAQDDVAAWGRALRAGAVSVSGSGRVAADTLALSSAHRTRGGRLQWELESLAADRVAIDDAALAAGAVVIERAIFNGPGQLTLNVSGLRAQAPARGVSTLLSSERLEAAALTLSDPEFGTVEADDVSATRVDVTGAGMFASDEFAAASVRYLDVGANRATLAEIRARSVTATSMRELRSERIDISEVAFERPDSARLDLIGVTAREAALAGEHGAIARAELEGAAYASAYQQLWHGAAIDIEELDYERSRQALSTRRIVVESLTRGDESEPSLQAGTVLIRNLSVHGGEDAELGTLSSSRVQWRQGTAEMRVAGVDAERVTLNAAKGVEVADLRAQAVAVGGSEANAGASLLAQRIGLRGLRYDGQAVNLGIVESEGVEVELERSPLGPDAWPLPWQFVGPHGIPLALRIESLRSTGARSRAVITDTTVAPAFRLVFEPLRFTLAPFDQQSSRLRFRLDAETGVHAVLGVEGVYDSEGQSEPGLQAWVRFANVELARWSTYARQYLDLDISGGRGHAIVEISLDTNALRAQFDVTFDELNAHAVRGERETARLTAAPVRLDQALAALEGRDGSVSLRFAIDASLDDPLFDLTALFMRELRRAIESTLVTTLAEAGVAIEPAGALQAGSPIRARPLRFGAGKSILSHAAMAYLDGVAALLEERPELRIKVCAKSTYADTQARSAPAAASFELAELRERIVRGYLGQRHLMPAERLVACPPEVETEAGRAPRVELLLEVAPG